MDFTKNNPSLARLFTAKLPEDNYLLQNKKLYRTLRIEAAILYEALFGASMDMEDYTLIIKSQNQEVQKIYGPSVGKDPDSNALAIKWGEKYVVLDPKLKGPELQEGYRWDSFGLAMANFGYKDDEIALSMMLETEDGFYDANLPLRFQDIKNAPDLAGFKTLMKKEPDIAYSLLFEVFEGAGGGGGQTVNKLQDLEEGTILEIAGVENYEFTTKKGEDVSRVLLVDKEGNKYWSPDGIGYIAHLFNNPTLEINKLAQGTKSKYIAAGVLYDDQNRFEFGSEVKATKEKELPAGTYRVYGFDSFQGKSNSFISYVYTIAPVHYEETEDENGETVKTEVGLGEDEQRTFVTCFAPSKHRVVLNSEPNISPETPAEFTIFVSGLEPDKKFLVGQIEAEFDLGEDAIDIDSLF